MVFDSHVWTVIGCSSWRVTWLQAWQFSSAAAEDSLRHVCPYAGMESINQIHLSRDAQASQYRHSVLPVSWRYKTCYVFRTCRGFGAFRHCKPLSLSPTAKTPRRCNKVVKRRITIQRKPLNSFLCPPSAHLLKPLAFRFPNSIQPGFYDNHHFPYINIKASKPA